jgi:predicted GNAT superfamily acetyltransferase
VELPEDIVAVRAADPAAGLQWRLKVRKDLQAAFADGYRIIGVADHGGYVLERTS